MVVSLTSFTQWATVTSQFLAINDAEQIFHKTFEEAEYFNDAMNGQSVIVAAFPLTIRLYLIHKTKGNISHD